MKIIKKYKAFLFLLIFTACGEIVSYPDIPVVNYKDFRLYITEDLLGNIILLVELDIEFTDGDGNIGINQPNEGETADSLNYNLFITLHEFKNGSLQKVEGSQGALNYRVPFMDRIGQNKTLKGTITVDIEYKTIEYDTIAYTFYLMDRAFNRSNIDTSDLIVFTGIEL